MFDITSSKLLILGIVALLVIGPKDFPALLRTIGKYIGIIKRHAAEFRAQFDEAMRETELDQLKKDVEKIGRETEASLRGRRADRWRRSSPRRARASTPAIDDRRTQAAADPRRAATPTACTGRRRPAEPSPPERRRRQRRGRERRPRRSAPRADAPSRAGRPRRAELRLTRCRTTVPSPQPEGQDEIDASKAPLIEHLIELRQRLIYALLGIGVGFVVCFAFATHIYNMLVWPYQVARGERAEDRDDLHRPARVLLHQAEAGPVRRRVPGVSDHRHQIYKFVAPGLYKNERQAFRPYLLCDASLLFIAGALVVYFVVMPLAMKFFLSMEQTGGQVEIHLQAQGQRISVADHDADPGLRHHVPAARGADACWPAPASSARSSCAIFAAMPSSPSPASPPCSRRPIRSA